jgi:hypothetical protein
VNRLPKKPKPPTYVPAPTLSPELTERYLVMMEVLSGQTTVSEGARRVSLSRVQFQTLLHRGQTAFIEAMAPQPAGRPKKSDEERRIAELERENRRLMERLETFERLLGVASSMLRGQTRGRPPKKKRTEGAGEDESDDAEVDEKLEAARSLSAVLPEVLIAAVVGASASTRRRWRRRRRAGELVRRRPGPKSRPPVLDREQRQKAEKLLRALHGQIGVEALRHSTGLTRRAARASKESTLTTMERERQANLTRVTVTRPGVLRGLDAMVVSTVDGRVYLLITADGSVPYRTAVLVVIRYDEAGVLAVLERDWAEHGAPLVLRLDRASCQRTPAVRALAAAHGVLILHGPPRHPGFYGQLERQNREHRSWLRALPPSGRRAVEAASPRMLTAWNDQLPRSTLGWRTAGDVWRRREPVTDDRQVLREEVNERAERMLRQTTVDGMTADIAERLAIQQALIARGYLQLSRGSGAQ